MPANTLKGPRYRIDARVRPGLHKKSPTSRPVHGVHDLVELLVLRLPYQFLFIQGAGPPVRAELRLSWQYQCEGCEPASGQHGAGAAGR